MTEFLNVIKENLSLVVSLPTLGSLLVILVRWGVGKLTSSLIPWVEKIVAEMISQSFGVTEAKNVSQVPIVGDIKRLVKQVSVAQEMELIRLKKETISPLYTAEERLIIMNAFNYLYDSLKDKVSNETKAILDTYDKLKGNL